MQNRKSHQLVSAPVMLKLIGDSKAQLSAVLTSIFVVAVLCVGPSSQAWGETVVVPLQSTGLDSALTEDAVPAWSDPQMAHVLPHEDLDRAEAIALLDGVFEPVLQAAAGPFDGLTVDRFLSDHAAVVSGSTDLTRDSGVVEGADSSKGLNSALIESTLPIKQENEVVDLSLEQDGGFIAPVNPLVEVRLPSQLGEGVYLPESGIRVRLPGEAGGRSPSIVEGTAVYPNVNLDSDLVVAPTPTGFETLTHLRSPDSPRAQRFHLELPSGASLESDGDGAFVQMGQRVLLRIPEPTAMDAAGNSVPVEVSASESSLTVTAMPDSEAQWPLLVDPLFESYQWDGTNLDACNEFQSTRAPLNYPSHYMSACGSRMGSWTQRGIGVAGSAGTYWPSWARMSHSVPRLWQDEISGQKPTSFLRAMSLSGVYMQTSGGSMSPYPISGIWDDALGDWSGQAPHKAVWGYPGNYPPISNATITYTSGDSHEAKTGVVSSLAVNEPSPTSTGRREMFVGGATFEVGDVDLPQILFPSGTGWVNAVAKDAITATVKDTGLGAKRATFNIPGHQAVTVEHACAGNVASPCPRTWAVSLGANQYHPDRMLQGENYVVITGQDVLGQQSSPMKAQVLVDHTAPALSLSGSLVEQGVVGVDLSEYTLNYNASDGDDAPAAPLTPFGAKGTGPGQLERPVGMAVDADGDIWTTDRTNNRIVQYDKGGKFISQFGVAGSGDGQLGDLRGIAVGVNGNLWVTQAGTKAVQQFTPAGNFVSKITRADFSAVWGIAISPSGVVWLADQNTSKVYRYKEDGTFLSSAYKNGLVPTGIDVDRLGNAWVASQGGYDIRQISATGTFNGNSFGSSGTGNGQFQNPLDVEVTDSGNIVVLDDPGRVQVFRPDGTFLRGFGGVGTDMGKFKEPRGIAVGPGNTGYISDAGNHRIGRWSHVDQDPQSGAAQVDIKVDGATVSTNAPGCLFKNCTISGSWTLNANKYSAGAHKIDVIATDAVGIQSKKSIIIETHGDLTDPSINLFGSMTEQQSLGTTRPSYKLVVAAADLGPAAERKSGIVSTTIKVDGSVVDSASSGCPAGGCSIHREWRLNADEYSVGSHTVEVKAIDGVGRSSVKSFPIVIDRDTTAPVFDTLGSLYTQPGGWVEQKPYQYEARVVDDGGYGVTSVELKVDGEVIRTDSQLCPVGSCLQLFAFGPLIDMEVYRGGSHLAELIATDGAGNMRKRSWTINVAPEGEVPPAEATSTLEAMEETVPSDKWFLPVAPTHEYLEPEIIQAGDNPHLKEEGGEIVSTGVTVDTSVDPSSGSVTIEGTEGVLEMVPQLPTHEADIVEGSAAVMPATNTGVDTVVRPEYSGAQMFTTIRDARAPENYEWRLRLNPGQYLVQANPQQIEVKWSSGVTAFLITADSAHDATGKHVPTGVSLVEGSSNIVFSIPHQNQGFTYPVAAGQGYETGYAMVTVYVPAEVAAEEAEDAEEPMTPEEWEDLNSDVHKGFLMPDLWNGPGPQRSRNKPFTRKQAKRLIRVTRSGREVPAPSASASGGPGSCCQDPNRYFETAGRVASTFNDDIWDVEIQDGNWRRNKTSVSDSPYDEPKCDNDVAWYWKANIIIGNQDEPDHLGPAIAFRGSGDHLTYRCTYTIFIGPVPVANVLENENEIQLRVFPNGYQSSHAAANNWRLIEKVW